jgi:hypothetical protein
MRHPAREIVTGLLAVMLLPVPAATNVESNIFAPLPTRIASTFDPGDANIMNLQRRIVPVKRRL